MKLFRKALFGICLALVSPLFFLIATVAMSRQQLLDYKDELTKKGETFDLGSLNTSLPGDVVSRTQNFTSAGAEIAAALKLSRLRLLSPPHSSVPGKRLIFHKQDLARVSGSIPYSWQDVEADCLAIEPALSRVRNSTQAGPIEFHPDYTLGYSTIVQGVAEAQAAAFALIGQSYAHLHNGKPEKAGENITAALRTTAMLYQQKTLMAQVLAIGLLNISANATWDLLQAEHLSDSTLLDLQNEWETVRIIESLKDTLRTERNFGAELFSFPPSRASIPLSALGSATDPLPLDALKAQSALLFWRTFFRYSDERQFILTYQAMIENAPADPRTGPWEASYREAEIHTTRIELANISRLISRLVFPSKKFVLYPVGAQTQAHITATAIAIRRYQLAHGMLPDSLVDLQKAFPEMPPLPDLFNGLPLHYHKTSDSEYLLYSVGINFKDDGGSDSDRSILKSKDIVWPSPLK